MITMAELESIAAAVRDALLSEGVGAALCEYPSGAKLRYTEPVVAVGIKKGSAVSPGFAEYMGELTDASTGASSELYGKRFDVTVSLGIYSPKGGAFGAQGCVDTFSAVAAALGAMPSGLRVRELSCGETRFDGATGMFLCNAEMKCTAFMYAVRSDEREILDFTLRGTMIG